MKAAVVYYSMSGKVDAAARRIAGELGADLIRLFPQTPYPAKGLAKFLHGGKSALRGAAPALQPYDFDAAAYDLVILGTPVWAGTFAPPLRSFLQDSREALQGKKIAAFASMMGSGGDKTLAKLQETTGVGELTARMILMDDKGKSAEKNEAAIRRFCRQCQ